MVTTEVDAQDSEAEEINEYATKLSETGSKKTATCHGKFSIM
jgi:hypothetical protein